jgi:anti-sigma regulatory factor (Ser/Thr protein kinase)
MQTIIWVGKNPPLGLEAHPVCSVADINPDGTTVVFDPPPAFDELNAVLPAWERRNAIAVVSLPYNDTWGRRAWHDAGVYCICRAHLTDAELYERLAQIRVGHQPTFKSQMRVLMPKLMHAHFTIATLDESAVLAELIALSLPNRLSSTAALVELLVNAIEHGNLGITAKEKQSLLMSGKWQQELNHRLASKPWSDRVVQVSFDRKNDECIIAIEDEGEGFQLENAARVDDPRFLRGRGLQIVKQTFNQVEWVGRGNRVVIRVSI